MKARPILFSAPMVRALLEGRKTQTRRAVKFPKWAFQGADAEIEDYGDGTFGALATVSGCFAGIECPYGVPGDLLWVRESTIAFSSLDELQLKYQDGALHTIGACDIAEDDLEVFFRLVDRARLRSVGVSSIHMPRWASRLTLRITDVRVQRLQEISAKDAIAEGIESVAHPEGRFSPRWMHYFFRDEGYASAWEFPENSYASLWDSITGTGSWDANPWVWALTFEVIKQNVDAVLASRKAA